MKKLKGRHAIKHANIRRIWLLLLRFIAYTALGFLLLLLDLWVANIFEVHVKEFNMEEMFPLVLIVFLFALYTGAIIGSTWALWVTTWPTLLLFVPYALLFIEGWTVAGDFEVILLVQITGLLSLLSAVGALFGILLRKRLFGDFRK